MAITPYVHKQFELILELLDTPKHFNELLVSLSISKGKLSSYLPLMGDLGYISRLPSDTFPKKFIYVRNISNLVTMTPEVHLETEKQPTIPGARLITFSSTEMQNKLKQQDRLLNSEKSRKSVYIGSTFNII